MQYLCYLTVLALPALAFAQFDPICHEPGICTTSSLLDYFHGVNESNVCLALCQEFGGDNRCQWWTYNPAVDDCFLYRDCNGATNAPIEEDCPECISGEDQCEPYYVCDLEGRCEGTSFDLQVTESGDECLALCKAEEDCEWYSWNSMDNYCFFYQDCDTRNNQTEFVSGEKECAVKDNSVPMHKVWIANGMNEAGTEVEVHDLTGNYNCSRPRDFPVSNHGGGGGFVGGAPMICGGTVDMDAGVRDCYTYDIDAYNWKKEIFRMSYARSEVAYVQLDENRLWITGGWGGQSYLSSSEIYDSERGTFSSGPSMERARGAHCLVKINGTRYFTVGGLPYGPEAYIYDFDTKMWEQVADIPETRYGAFCGKATDSDGLEIIVVAAGWVSGGFARQTYIYHIANDTWTLGAAFPESTDSGASVAYAGSFLAIDGNGADENIYSYLGSSGTWRKQSLNTEYDRYSNVAFLIPDDYYSCGEPVDPKSSSQAKAIMEENRLGLLRGDAVNDELFSFELEGADMADDDSVFV